MVAPLYPLLRVFPFARLFGLLVALMQFVALVLLVLAVLYWMGLEPHAVVWDWFVGLLEQAFDEAAPW